MKTNLIGVRVRRRLQPPGDHIPVTGTIHGVAYVQPQAGILDKDGYVIGDDGGGFRFLIEWDAPANDFRNWGGSFDTGDADEFVIDRLQPVSEDSVLAVWERDALLAYLSGNWHDCTHAGIGLAGCPTCEGRWSKETRRAVQSHRDRIERLRAGKAS